MECLVRTQSQSGCAHDIRGRVATHGLGEGRGQRIQPGIGGSCSANLETVSIGRSDDDDQLLWLYRAWQLCRRGLTEIISELLINNNTSNWCDQP